MTIMFCVFLNCLSYCTKTAFSMFICKISKKNFCEIFFLVVHIHVILSFSNVFYCYVSAQVQDYYVTMRLNSLSSSIKALYRLMIVSIMLYKCKVPNTGQSHNYPKMMMSYLLIVEYWRTKKHYTISMMKQEMYCMNEELGEVTFSVLSRCVLGDFMKSDFEHMKKMYSLLPVYMNIKEDILRDTNRKDAITWRHKIDTNCDEVRSTAFFFKRMIQSIMHNRHQSYDGSPASFSSEFVARQHMVESTAGLVYIEDITDICIRQMKQMRKELYGNFLSSHHDIWPVVNDIPSRSRMVSTLSDNSEAEDELLLPVWGPVWEDCTIGSYAIMRTEYEEKNVVKNGLCVYEVVERNSDTEIIHDHNNLAFMGIELFCTRDNTCSSCLRDGQWNRHRNRNALTKVYNYTVICYFDSLLNNQRLTAEVVNKVREIMRTTKLFSTDDL